MSPPLVVAFALAGRVDIDLSKEPLGKGHERRARLSERYLADLARKCAIKWQRALTPEVFRRLYRDFAAQNPKWNEIPSTDRATFTNGTRTALTFRNRRSSQISARSRARFPKSKARAPWAFLATASPPITSRRPAASRKLRRPGKYLLEHGVTFEDFNSYGSRRGNDRVMTRGTFANVRIKNLMVPGTEGGVTRCFAKMPRAARTMSIYRCRHGIQGGQDSLIVLAGQEYGTGSSRDWAAKGTALLGVKCVVAQSFERIHRSNLVGMGVLPLQFKEGTTAQTLQTRRHRNLRCAGTWNRLETKTGYSIAHKQS